MDDLIRRERKIDEFGVRKIFTPFSPIKSSEFLSGREDEIACVYSSLNTPGQHSLIYGERGIGKTSLANVISFLASRSLRYKTFLKKCFADDTFVSIVSGMLLSKGYDSDCVELVRETSENGSAKIGLNFLSASLGSTRKRHEKLCRERVFSSPAWVAEVLKDERFLLVLDEVDVLNNDLEKEKIAIFMKHLSDLDSQLKILIVGISSTGRDLVKNHKSLERCMNEIYLKPIKISALQNIIHAGARKLQIKFDEQVIDDIVDISGGYPHFVHLIALKCAETAVINNRREVSLTDLAGGLSSASRFSEGKLIRTYEAAIKQNSDASRKVLLGGALCHPKGFLVAEIVEMVNQVLDPGLPKSIIRNCLSRWTANSGLNLLTRVSRGQYRFCDPRFMSYIKMKNGFTYDKRSVVADILKSNYAKRFIE